MAKQKIDPGKVVTDTLIAMIENDDGTKWEKCWKAIASDFPINPITKNTYQGSNHFWLMLTGMLRGYSSNYWAGYGQWNTVGSVVRKGEKGTMVFVPITYGLKDKDGNAILDNNGEEKFRQTFNVKKVFNSEQVSGWEAPKLDLIPLAERLENAEKWCGNTGAVIKHGGNQAFFAPKPDYIMLPEIAAFQDTETATATENYYGVKFHELGHWTGHEKRLDRNLKDKFDGEGYAFEELVAELSSAMQCAHLKISSSPRPDHAKYLKNWLKVFKNNSQAIFKAAAMAQKSITYIQEQQ